MDWEVNVQGHRQPMNRVLAGLPPDDRWAPRGIQACVFCARRFWREDLIEAFLSGPSCFMKNPKAVAGMLAWELYHEAWPDIPEEELKGSAVSLPIDIGGEERLVLLHKRRVDDDQRLGRKEVLVCQDCHEAFSPKKPYLCRFALANHLWLGRWDPLFRNSNLTHQMLLALARIVTTKVVLRPEGNLKSSSGGSSATWDFLFHQSGMIGSAILFGNASCKKALTRFPPASVQGEFAVSFVGNVPVSCAADSSPPASSPDDTFENEGLDEEQRLRQLAALRAVKGIAKLTVHRAEFDAQAAALQRTNVVYKNTTYDAQLVASWCPHEHEPRVPPPLLQTLVAVPPAADGDEDPADPAGRVLASGPADATAAGEAERADADVEAAKQARFVSAFHPDDIPGAQQSSTCLEVAALQHQLEEIQGATKRSIAAEVESAIEGGARLVDEAGRERILEMCKDLRKHAQRLSQPERLAKLQAELQKAALGHETWQRTDGESGAMSELICPRGDKPLSLWDWSVWAQARPTLWRYGDAGNLDPRRTSAPLLTHEWITAMCIREAPLRARFGSV